MRPTFLLIGAPKTGTTSVYEYLRQHPQVFMAAVKEPHYFMAGEEYHGPGSVHYRRHSVHEKSAYEALFDTPSPARGEATPLYLWDPGAPERIRDLVPDVRLLVVLRHPVERAYAHFLHHRRTGLEPFRSFHQALADAPRRVREGWLPWFRYQDVGYYGRQLERYYRVFRPEQIGVYLHEDLLADSAQVMQAMYRHIGVDDGFQPDTSIRHHRTFVPRSRWLRRMVKQGPPGLRDWVGSWNDTRPRFPEAMRAPLLDAYHDDLLLLQTLLHRDLSAWLARNPRATAETPRL